MTSLNNTEKINFITNNFHQYFDLEVNTNLETNEAVNLVIPMETLTEQSIVSDNYNFSHFVKYEDGYKIDDILNKYEDTSYEGIRCICTKVVDGDTIYVKIPQEKDGQTFYQYEKVRLVGINTPEKNCNGYDVSKNFLEKVCYSKEYLNKLNKIEKETKEDIQNGVSIQVLYDYMEEFRIDNRADLNCPFINISISNDLSGKLKLYFDDTDNDNEIIYFEKSLDEIDEEKKKDDKNLVNFTCYSIFLEDIENSLENFINNEFFTIAFMSQDDVKIESCTCQIIKNENIISFKNSQHELLYEIDKWYYGLNNNKPIYLKFDSLRDYDNTNQRRLAVLIVNNKNINEVILKEGLGEIWYIPPSEFYPYDWGTLNTNIHRTNFQNDDISVLYPYFNNEMTNIVFTPQNDPKTIYRYEFYKGVFYIQLKPFSQYIRMHILPKAYNCSNVVLLFRDNEMTYENIEKTDDYYHYDKDSIINAYYLIDNNGEEEIRDRNNPDISEEQYNKNDWTRTFCDFSYDISKSTKSINNLQICAGYRYNKSSPFYSLHYTGVRDKTNIAVEDRCTLIDANYDKLENISNNITQYNFNEEFYIPNPPVISSSYPENIDHTTKIGKKYHKTLKYINDLLYSEEEKKYTIAEWVDISRG